MSAATDPPPNPLSATPLAALLVCHECDLLYRQPVLQPGQTAHCVRCHAVLCRSQPQGVQRATAFGLAALIFYAIANAWPFLSMGAQGQTREISLLTCVTELYRHQMPGLALFATAILLIAPLLQILGLLYVLIPLGFSRRLPQAAGVCRLIAWLTPWSMTEIHLLGTVVALVKLAAMGDIILGVAFWALLALVLTLAAATATLHPHSLWTALAQAQPWPRC
jgi:paraquat-inducible protein A